MLIDGRSGAGKSTLADLVLERMPNARLLRMEAVYPGWGGLAEAGEIILHDVLEPRSLGRNGGYREWDWVRGAAGQHRVVPSAGPLIVEGCGALTPASARFADVSIWADAAPERRRARALARDGEGYRPYWDMWAAQEDAHVGRHDPRSLATIVLDLP